MFRHAKDLTIQYVVRRGTAVGLWLVKEVTVDGTWLEWLAGDMAVPIQDIQGCMPGYLLC